jgi:tRNA-modifying protein YgfZ
VAKIILDIHHYQGSFTFFNNHLGLSEKNALAIILNATIIVQGLNTKGRYPTMPQHLSHLGLLKVTGIDARKLLQGQLTCNLDELDARQLGAHCNPQGRVLSLFRISAVGDSYYLEMPAEILPTALQALKKYAVFYKVELSDASAELDQISTAAALSLNEWKTSNIEAGIPAIYAATSGKLLPHEINLPELNAVSFNKGCFTGQEIIARMHYRGQLKKRMYRARVTAKTAPVPGADIYAEQGPAGTVVDSCKETGDSYQVLVVANQENQQLFLDPDKIEPLEFVSLPSG